MQSIIDAIMLDTPIPVKHLLISLQTWSADFRKRCPIPNSIRNNGTPSMIMKMKNGMRNEPKQNLKPTK